MMLEGAQFPVYSSAPGTAFPETSRTMQLMQAYGAMRTAQDADKAKEEFLAVFYKELLKQTFKTPTFAMGEEDNGSLNSVFTSDLLMEKMAMELARNKAFSGIEEW